MPGGRLPWGDPERKKALTRLEYVMEFCEKIAAWSELVEKHATTKCFKGIARLLHASLEDMVGILKGWSS